jgi:hypothetical protein
MLVRVPFGSDPNGTLPWPALHVQRGRAQYPALEMTGPAPHGVDSTLGSQLIELIDPLEKSADRARVNPPVVFGDLADQAMPITGQGQERCPESRVFGVEGCFRDAPRPARDGSLDPVSSRLSRMRLTL